MATLDRKDGAADHAGGKVRDAAQNPVLEFLERVGYVFRGLLYLVMGILALQIATSHPGGKATDQTGSLLVLVSNPFGKFVLIAFIIGLGAYSIWGFVRAIYDPLHRGKDANGIVQRLGMAWSGFAYGAMVIFALQFLGGKASGAHQDPLPPFAASLLSHPFGYWLTLIAGFIAIAAGVGQFIESRRAGFRKDLKLGEMSHMEKGIAIGLGRFGYFARGIVFVLVGYFLTQAAQHHDASQAKGYGGAFLALFNEPFGQGLLAIVALGFIALGLHSFAQARYQRLMGSD